MGSEMCIRDRIATALVITTFFLIINMIVDFVVLLLNPRITPKD